MLWTIIIRKRGVFWWWKWLSKSSWEKWLACTWCSFCTWVIHVGKVHRAVKPVYKGPVYSGDPVYYSHWTISWKFCLTFSVTFTYIHGSHQSLQDRKNAKIHAIESLWLIRNTLTISSSDEILCRFMTIYYPSYLYIFTHAFSRHLNGAVLETLSRPSLLITDSFNALNVQARRRERDTQLMSKFLSCISV